MEIYDLIIIGTGPAGLTAAIYAARREMKTLLIGKEIGGQVVWAREIENYPGFKIISNLELIKRWQEQINFLKIPVINTEVNLIENQNDIFIVHAAQGTYHSRTIILATGVAPRQLNIPGEKEFTGRGVSYCANCDGPFFKNKKVVVVGGGNAALDAAEVMTKIASQVVLVHRDDKFRAFEVLIKKVMTRANLEIRYHTEVTAILGNGKVAAVRLRNNRTQSSEELPAQGVFVEIGHEAKTGWLKDLVVLDEGGQIVIDKLGATSHQGIFAAGDVTASPYKQITVACGQGATAALSAYQYLQLASA
ncbi:thioredoxin-disulfide reductase [Candidatus Wolfebacteria bacterium RBG_13_41_7]|uniref:Thioredoxin reductase n=1 Tax=Candidatus Wolfebacteria bacterium RBG_13_41_7 TaxID=1802554 RepID=A0A1F8DKM8_9BACT|nr:MAG: thioredoxin-disulfide reductase [Candidatus Wolfebacteria bacterium RBG_13_41_7]